MINFKLGLCVLLIVMTGCTSTVIFPEGDWIQGDPNLGAIQTVNAAGRSGFVRTNNYWYRSLGQEQDNIIEIFTDGRSLRWVPYLEGSAYQHMPDRTYGDAIHKLAYNICSKKIGSKLKEVVTETESILGFARSYPTTIRAVCMSGSEYAEHLQDELRIKSLIKERDELSRQETLRKAQQNSIDKLKLKQEDCSSFGFESGSTEHADCVMKLTIAERQQQKDAVATARLASLRRAQLAQQQEADSKAAEQAKRRRDGALLMGIGGNISAGRSPLDFSTPKESTSEKDSTPSGYKNCRYRVGGGIVSVAISNAQVCASTRQFDGNLGYLTQ